MIVEPDQSKVRVSVAQKNAVLAVIAKAATYPNPAAFAEELAAAVLTADDEKLRYCVVTQNPKKEVYVFGPYGTRETATKAISTGALASVEKTIGGIFPLIPAPKKPKTKTTTTRKKG